MELAYEKNGDYLIPNLIPDSGPEEPRTKYGLMHKDYLEKNHRGIFCGMLLEGTQQNTETERPDNDRNSGEDSLSGSFF